MLIKPMNRRQILHRLDELHETVCEVCSVWKDRNRGTGRSPSQCFTCPTYEEIRTLGEALLQNPRRSEKIRFLLDKGADMDSTDIQLLVGQDVKKSVIRKAMNISREEFSERMLGTWDKP